MNSGVVKVDITIPSVADVFNDVNDSVAGYDKLRIPLKDVYLLNKDKGEETAMLAVIAAFHTQHAISVKKVCYK